MSSKGICATCWHVRVVRPERHKYTPAAAREIVKRQLETKRYCTKGPRCHHKVKDDDTCNLHWYNPLNTYERDYRTGRKIIRR